MKILCVGDIVGKPGRHAIHEGIPALRQEYGLDMVIANAENAAAGAGITSRIAKQLIAFGCDVLTSGDHIWDQKELEGFLPQTTQVLRPANFPEDNPGLGWVIHLLPSGQKVGVINMLGRVFMRYYAACPFRVLEKIVTEMRKETSVIIVDIHAEATSEKIALGHFSDGKVSVVFGTHTHVQTADEKVLPKGTAYITDVGMTGPYDSVIGQHKDAILQRYWTGIPVRFAVAENDIQLHGIVVDIDEQTGFARSITRIQRMCSPMPKNAEKEE